MWPALISLSIAFTILVGLCEAGTQIVTPAVLVRDGAEEALVDSVKDNSSRKGRSRSLRDFLTCVAESDYGCVVDSSEEALRKAARNLLVEADAAALKQTGRSGEEQSPSHLVQTLSKLISEFANIFQSGVAGFFRTGKEEDDEDDEEEEEGKEEETQAVEEQRGSKNKETEIKSRDNGETRGKKKKKKKAKLFLIIKLLILGIIIKAKLALLLKILAFKLQVKFFLIALANLVMNVIRFYLDLKKGHHPQKVIYYEHAQHQHHYDGKEDDWAEPSSSGGSYWGRADDEEENKGSAQDLAYSKQKPYYYSVVNNKPNYSWWGR